MADRLLVQGSLEPEGERTDDDFVLLYGRDVDYRVHQRVTTRAGGSRGDQEQVDIDGDDSDVLEVETVDGLVRFMTVREAKGMARSRGSSRFEAAFSGVRGGRSPISRVARTSFQLKDPEIRLALEQLQDSLGEKAVEGVGRAILDPLARAAMKKIADWVDRPVADGEPASVRRKGAKSRGLYRVQKGLLLEPGDRVIDELEPPGQPYLVLLHGTFSHTEAAFAGLRGTAEWESLLDHYGGRVLALEHATLGRTPAENALELAAALPAKTQLHLVSHSRGGLIGEALTMASSGMVDTSLYRDAHASTDPEVLARLHKEMRRGIQVERFVRIACPGSGTILASRRVERYAEYMFNLLRLTPGLQGTGVVAVVKLLLLTFLDQRSDVRAIPGLEAQMPESPFIRTLNTRAGTVDDDMAAVAGDVQGSGIAQRLKVLGADLFFREDHDMVVNTSAMVAGVNRKNPSVAFFKGPAYSHSSYFNDPASRAATQAWLTKAGRGTRVSGFEPALPKAKPRRFGFRGSPEQRRGTVVIVPDLMGTEIYVGDQLAWPSPTYLATDVGDFLKEPRWEPRELVEEYDGLREQLQLTYEVVGFGYDGRKSLTETAALLRDRIDDLLSAADAMPIHLVGHGSGGEVIRRAHDQSATLLTKTRGRVVLVSPPLLGTATAVARRAGRELLSATLGVVDGSDPTAVASVFCDDSIFPSLLELDPRTTGLMGSKTWDRFLAIYGRADRTFALDRDGSGNVVVSMRGDGHILWEHVPKGLTAYYAAIPLRDLLSDRSTGRLVESFLETGVSPPSSSPAVGEIDEDSPAPDHYSVLFPTPVDLVRAGLPGAESVTTATEHGRLEVRIMHGNLTSARERLIVGTQYGTPIGGAEKALDDRLEGVLSRHRLMGQYPGPLGTCQLFLRPDLCGPGAAVIGVGDPGDLSPGALTAGYATAVLRLVAATMNEAAPVGEPSEETVPDGAELRRDLDIGTVLIGTSGAGGLAVASAVNAAITGVRRANRRIRDLKIPAHVRSLRVYELYEDRAIDALDAARRLRPTATSMDEDQLIIHDLLEEGVDGRPGSPRSEYLTDRWRTIRVSGIKQGRYNRPLVDLTFTEIGRTAGAPSRITSAQRQVIQRLVEESIGSSVVDDQIYNTLYELLVPRSMKGQGRPSEHLMYILDEHAVSLPWEMLATRSFDDGVVPLAIEVGMIRRLETTQLRELIRSSSARKALVVGAPYAGVRYLPLPGAISEANLVADLLESRGWEVTRLISRDPEDRSVDAYAVLNALFAHEYRIIHITGHGEYDSHEPTRSGVCIGEGVYLTAFEFEQMQTTPDLVFLNCCHSGAGVGQADKLAASVARKLIDNGIRAVVAAGWAVDDDAAATFARRFYDGMLSGEYLGKAALDARRDVYNTFGQATNTWGAYQVYGEPALQIERDRPSGDIPELVSRRSFREKLWALGERAKFTQPEKVEDLAAELDALQLAGDAHGWLQGEEHQSIGEAWRALGRYGDASKAYKRALEAGGSTASFAILTQLVSAQGHLGAEHARAKANDRGSGSDYFKAAEDLLQMWENLLESPPKIVSSDPAETPDSEIFSTSESRAQLLKARGNILQHKIWTATTSQQRLTAIQQALAAFREAAEVFAQLQRRSPGRQPSQAAQYVTVSEAVLTWLELINRRRAQPDSDTVDELVGKVLVVRAVAEQVPWSTAPFERLRIPDADLALHLLRRNPSTEDVRKSYCRVFDKGVTMRERETIVHYLMLVERCLPRDSLYDETRLSLTQIRDGLAPWL